MAQSASQDDRALRRRLTRSLEQLASGRWVAWGGSAMAAGATRAEALSSLGSLLDEHPTIPDEAVKMGEAIAAELGLTQA